ncbi:MAG: phosphatidylserine decarboxylase family protein [Desulfovibrio sp.]|nr:phosphatidylserine decarboxylase family protein [Desulfovibrio sp.]
MKIPATGVAPEGKPFIYLAAFASLVFALLSLTELAVICLALCAFCVYFFRDPERVVPDAPDSAVSPADGRILHIRSARDPLDGRPCTCISIFMNLFNVHVNRAPIASQVIQLKYYEGKFFNASLDKASEHNERCAWKLLDSDGETWVMVQIAGLVARRIVVRAEVGDSVMRGERVGLIRFGSRVDLYLPASYHAEGREGDRVLAGQTVIARRK